MLDREPHHCAACYLIFACLRCIRPGNRWTEIDRAAAATARTLRLEFNSIASHGWSEEHRWK